MTMQSVHTLLFLLIPLLGYQCTAFAPVHINIQQRQVTLDTKICKFKLHQKQVTFDTTCTSYAQSSSKLQQSSSFDKYSQTDEQELAFDDTIIGTGNIAEVGSFVTIQYTGKLLADDTTFDSGLISFKLGEGQVIPGWEQGIIGMKVNGKRTLKIPPRLAYGERGVNIIPGGAHLLFETELKSIASNGIEESIAKFRSLNPLTSLAIWLVLFNAVLGIVSAIQK